ncbi:MAG: helix-turn-helix domain-containing protein [Acidobacteriota bacterium]|jgi:DNA-binding transcriptional MerR regulator
MADEPADNSEKKLYTLTEVSKKTGISMPTLQRYKKSYQDRIPSVGEGRTQRYPEESLPVFKQIKKENVKRRGRPPKSESKKAPGRPKKKKKSTEGLLTLTKIAEETNISYPTLVRYVKLYKDRIPHKGSGRSRRFYPEAIEVFQQIRSESPRGRKKKSAAPARRGRRPARAAAASNGDLARRIDALERSNADLEKQIRELVKQFKKPLKVTIKR